nr:hypothetical protein [Tanacetum cinerariifolium]
SSYARALIEVSAKKELMESIVIAIPLGKDKGHFLATVEIEYEWNPPRCNACLVFDHTSENCPKKPKEIITSDVSAKDVVNKDTADDDFENTQQVLGVLNESDSDVDEVITFDDHGGNLKIT